MSIFDKHEQTENLPLVGKVMSAVEPVLNGSASQSYFDTGLAGKFALESESLGQVEQDNLKSKFDQLKDSLMALESANIHADDVTASKGSVGIAAEAGALGALAAAGVNKLIGKNPFAPVKAPEGGVAIQNYMGISSVPRVATEAYDEREIQNSVKSSIALNYAASRQNAFGELFYKSVILSPDQTGYHMHLHQINVMKEQRRSITGEFNRFFDRINLLKAAIDPEILSMNATELVPVYDENKNKKHFVDTSDLALQAKVDVQGVKVQTHPLKFDARFGLIDISQHEALVRAGVLDETDALDPAINLEAVYLKAGDDVIKLGSMSYLTSSNFVPAPQGDHRDMILAFEAAGLPLTAKTVKVDGGDLSANLAHIKTNEWTVRIGFNINGRVNLQDSGCHLSATSIRVSSIVDKDGKPVDTASGQGQQVVQALEGAKLLGYDLQYRLTNSNIRQRGLLLDMSSYSILYVVPLLGPITIKRPLARGEEHQQSDLAALITATRMFTSSSAVTALEKVRKLLATYITHRDMGSDLDSEYLGIARRLVQPYYQEEKLDVKQVIASLKSEDRPKQVQAVLVNKIRDMVFRAWYISGFGVAADYVFGGDAPAPIVKIGCDPVLARYLQVEGDLRTLGGKFDVRIEASWDKRMKDKIYIAFGYETAEGETNYHVLDSGMMLWKPEVVVAAPIYVQGATSHQLTVQPSFLHVWNVPIMMYLEVSNIDKAAVDKIAVDTHSV